jgi:hypothetical protein
MSVIDKGLRHKCYHKGITCFTNCTIAEMGPIGPKFYVENKKFWEELIAYFPWHDNSHI